MDFLNTDRIAASLDELKLAALQVKVTTAAAHELIANANVTIDKLGALLDKANAIVEAVSKAGKG